MVKKEVAIERKRIADYIRKKDLPGISIVVPTLGRKKELYDLLESIYLHISDIHYELIIVDQNRDDLLKDLQRNIAITSIKHFHVNFSGAAQARNFGVKYATMPYVFFADDDMKFISDSLERALIFLEEHKEFCAVSGCMVNENNEMTISCFSQKAHSLDLKKHFRGYFVESSLLFRSDLFTKYEFDENLGCGRFHGAEEGADLVFRMLSSGENIYYNPDLKYYHPAKVNNYIYPEEIRRVFFYSAGLSKFCFKNRQYVAWWKRFVAVCGYLVFLTLTFSPKRRYYFSELLGLLSGVIIR